MAQELNLNVNHIVAESTNILATNFGGAHIYNILVSEDMDNGLLCARAEYLADEYEDEVWTMKEYAAGDEPLLLLAPPLLPMTELRGYNTEDKFYNAEGDRVRAYTLRVGDRITLSENAFDTAPVEKQYVTYDAAAKQYVVGDAKTEGEFCAQVLTKIYRTNMTMYKIMIVGL